MNATQLPFLVEGILILITLGLGVLIWRAGKPYGKVKLGFHLFLYLWFTFGFCFIAAALPLKNVSNRTWGFVAAMALAIVIQLVTGLWMLFSKKRSRWMPMVHGVSATVLILSDLAAYFLTGLNS
jgi:uncharacterized membrane protein